MNCTSATHTTPTGSFAKFLQTREDAEVKYNKKKGAPTAAMAWRFVRDPGERGIFAHHSDGNF